MCSSACRDVAASLNSVELDLRSETILVHNSSLSVRLNSSKVAEEQAPLTCFAFREQIGNEMPFVGRGMRVKLDSFVGALG